MRAVFRFGSNCVSTPFNTRNKLIKPKIQVLTILLLFRIHCFSQELDSIFLYNGQVLIREIITAKPGIITIDDKDLKLTNIKLYKIKYRVAERNIFRIQTNNNNIYYTVLKKTGAAGEIEIEVDGKKIKLPLTEFFFLVSLEIGFFTQLDGNFGLSFSYTISSNIGSVNMNTTVYYNTCTIGYQFAASAIYSIDSSRLSGNNENAQVFGRYAIGASWYLAALLNYQSNLEFSFVGRYQKMAGAGNKLV